MCCSKDPRRAASLNTCIKTGECLCERPGNISISLMDARSSISDMVIFPALSHKRSPGKPVLNYNQLCSFVKREFLGMSTLSVCKCDADFDSKLLMFWALTWTLWKGLINIITDMRIMCSCVGWSTMRLSVRFRSKNL